MSNAPGFAKYPDHRIALKPAGGRVQVTYRGELVADSREAIEMREAAGSSTVAPKVYYIPRKDVRMERLAPTAHTTYCPFKGRASYFSFKDGPENAAWSYEHPYDEMAAIEGHLAFYPDKVDSIDAAGQGGA